MDKAGKDGQSQNRTGFRKDFQLYANRSDRSERPSLPLSKVAHIALY